MNIALIHFRVGELDGVSLEMDKWRKVLKERYGHNVIYLAGTLGKSDGYAIPELSMDYPPATQIRKESFSNKLSLEEEKSLKLKIQDSVDLIKPKLQSFIDNQKIDCFIVNNMFCYPLNIPASLALAEVIDNNNMPVINHNHDFFWERTTYNPSCDLITEYLGNYFPPNKPDYKQVVINTNAKDALKRRSGIDSTYVPNVFYFEDVDWSKDKYNSDIRDKLQIQKNDIVFLQATRIVERKGIELVIDLIYELNKPEHVKKLASKPLFDGRNFQEENKLILVMPNLVEDESYKEKLENKCKKLHVDYRFCNDIFAHQRVQNEDGSKIYSLWDAYTISDIVTYPSLLEGWGNQFLEAVKGKLPIIIFEYDVYKKDIGPMGFKTISLGSKYSLTENGFAKVPDDKIISAVPLTIELLHNMEKRKKIVNKNYEIGLKKFSIEALGKYISPLINEL